MEPELRVDQHLNRSCVSAHSRINIIRPTLNTRLNHIRANFIVRNHTNANLCPRDKSSKLCFVLNVHNLDF